jgi:hypothetical protein
MISITAVTNDRTMQTISARVEAHQKKREMLPAPVSDDVSDVEVVEVEQEGEARVADDEDPTGEAKK